VGRRPIRELERGVSAIAREVELELLVEEPPRRRIPLPDLVRGAILAGGLS